MIHFPRFQKIVSSDAVVKEIEPEFNVARLEHSPILRLRQ